MTKAQAQNDVPLPLAALALLAVASGYFYLTYFRFEPVKIALLRTFAEANSALLWTSLCAMVVNLAFISIFLRRTIGLERQGRKLEVMQGKRRRFGLRKVDFIAFACGIVGYLVSSTLLNANMTRTLLKIICKSRDLI